MRKGERGTDEELKKLENIERVKEGLMKKKKRVSSVSTANNCRQR